MSKGILSACWAQEFVFIFFWFLTSQRFLLLYTNRRLVFFYLFMLHGVKKQPSCLCITIRTFEILGWGMLLMSTVNYSNPLTPEPHPHKPFAKNNLQSSMDISSSQLDRRITNMCFLVRWPHVSDGFKENTV